MSEHGKKKIAPIVITILVILYYLLYFGFLIYEVPFAAKLLLGIVPVCLIPTMIYVCGQRLKEIDGGEEDDLSKY